MAKLFFERIEDVNVDRPYLFVFLLEDDQTYWVGKFSQFLYLSINSDNKLCFTFYPSANPLTLTHEEWKEILQVGETFLSETLKRIETDDE
jgi:hypothetical protein